MQNTETILLRDPQITLDEQAVENALAANFSEYIWN